MREIKIRAWDEVAKQWLRVTGIETAETSKGYGYTLEGIFHDGDFAGHEGIVVTQYTGLKDKNGKEIYEGDVLEAEHKLKIQKFKRKYQVIFNEKGYWDAISLDDKPVKLCYAGFDKCEVIGNIFENPELLEVIK